MDIAELAGALRAAARDALARLPDEPWLHVKRVLAEHAEEDKRFAAAIEAHLGISADATTASQVDFARAARALADAAEDEAQLALLLGIAAAQDRHRDELPRVKNACEAFFTREPFVMREAGAAPDEIDEALKVADAAAARGDARAAADAMRWVAELDRQRTLAGDPWGVRPIPPAG
jgi:hypothetical protein